MNCKTDLMFNNVINDFPQGSYGVVLADPPWTWSAWSERGEGKSPSQHYNTMTLNDIINLPVKDIAAPHSVLFLWVTWPMIFAAQEVIKSWGFEYSGLAWEWIKYNSDTNKYAFGCGYGTRKNVEPCLLARRGKPKLKSRSVRDILFAKRREHSRKPDEQYQRIQDMYDGPYLELFARQSREGWDAWGNECDKFSCELVSND